MEGGLMTQVLYDVPGPRARTRNRVIGVAGSLLIVAALAYVVQRFAVTGQFDAQKWSILQYEQVQRTLLDGYLNTLRAAAVAAMFAVTLGALLAAARLSDHVALRWPSFAVVEVFRAVPLVLLMFLFYYGTPSIGLRVSPFLAVVLGLTLYNGAVLAEIFRAGVEAVPRGQAEAAYALGMRKTAVMTTVLLPQAIRSMLPTIISQLVVLLKDTALGFLVTYDELLKQVRQLGGAPQFDYPLIPLALVAGSVYIATCLLLSRLAVWSEARLSRSEKVAAAPPSERGPRELTDASAAAPGPAGTGPAAGA
jgi:glutamate transport system permease protein